MINAHPFQHQLFSVRLRPQQVLVEHRIAGGHEQRPGITQGDRAQRDPFAEAALKGLSELEEIELHPSTPTTFF